MSRDLRELTAPALLGDAAECAQLGVSVYDDDGRYVTANEQACTLLGYSREELMQRDVADFTKGGIDRTVLRSNHRREGVRLLTRKDGTQVPAAFVVVPTRVAGIPFYFAVWWELAPDDPRAATAA
jgi:PAS domain S-box-containing protein